MATHEDKWLTIVIKVLKLPFLCIICQKMSLRSTSKFDPLVTSTASKPPQEAKSTHLLHGKSLIGENGTWKTSLKQHFHAGSRDLDHHELDQCWSVSRRCYEAFHHQLGLARVCKKQPHQFKRVIDRLKAHGPACTPTGEEDIQTVLQHFTDNPHDSLRKAEAELTIRRSSLLKILKTKIKMELYKPSIGYVLEERHEEGRRTFCDWLLEQPDNFPQDIIFGDEKWFSLHQAQTTIKITVSYTELSCMCVRRSCCCSTWWHVKSKLFTISDNSYMISWSPGLVLTLPPVQLRQRQQRKGGFILQRNWQPCPAGTLIAAVQHAEMSTPPNTSHLCQVLWPHQ